MTNLQENFDRCDNLWAEQRKTMDRDMNSATRYDMIIAIFHLRSENAMLRKMLVEWNDMADDEYNDRYRGVL